MAIAAVYAVVAGFKFRLSLGGGRTLRLLHNVKTVFPMTSFLAGLYALALGLSLAMPRWRRLPACAALCLLGVSLTGRCVLAYSRNRQDPQLLREVLESRPTAAVALPKFRGMRMPPSDARLLNSLTAKLSGLPPERKPVFIYGSCEIFYPLIGQPVPQPLLIFAENLNFRKDDGTEERIISDLEKNRVRSLLRCGLDDNFKGLPQLRRWIEARAEFDSEETGWKLYRLKTKY